MRRQDAKACKADGSMYVVDILQATAARAAHRSFDVWPKAVHNLLQLRALSPEGRAAPCVLRGAARITSPVMFSKISGWKSTLVASLQNASRCAGCGSGCLSSRTSLTVFLDVLSMILSSAYIATTVHSEFVQIY